MANPTFYLWSKLLQLTRKVDLAAKIVDQFPAPEKVLEKTIYVIGPRKRPKWIALRCPCGCGEQLNLSLMKQHSPNWEIKIKKTNITISPSVWKTDGCRSHFFVRKSKVIWASNYLD